jgi:hypothetical protein
LALTTLFSTGPGYAKYFECGVRKTPTASDISIISNFLHSGVLSPIIKYQKMNILDLDEICEEYLRLDKGGLKEEIYKFFGNEKTEWAKVMLWVVAETVKDSSIMMKWVEGEEITGVQVKVIDIDMKLVTKIPDYRDEMEKFFTDYAKYLLVEQGVDMEENGEIGET